MVVIGSGGTASRTVIEEREVLILSCQIQHVHISVPDRLVHMPVHGYNQMVREYGIWIDQDMVLFTFPAFELYELLERQAPEEADSGRRIQIRCHGVLTPDNRRMKEGELVDYC